MKEKKLNDAEIIKALEHCLNGDYKTKCKGCHYDKSKGYCQDMDRDALDLIHRLQSENETLKSELKKELAEHEEFTKNAKAEIERLTADLISMDREHEGYIETIKELQNQVDEFKEKQVIECHGMFKGCDMVEQAVKDTAKEIIEMVESLEERPYVSKEDFKTSIKKRYGVEVEE